MVSPTYSQMSSEKNNAHMCIHTRGEYNKTNETGCKLFSLGRIYRNSLYYSYNCPLFLKLYIKVKSCTQKKFQASGECRRVRTAIFTFVYAWNFPPLKQLPIPSLRCGLGGADPESLDTIYIRGQKVWAKRSTWICGALLHILSSQLTPKRNNYNLIFTVSFFFLLMIKLIPILSGGNLIQRQL